MEAALLGALGGFIASVVLQGITAALARRNFSRLGAAIVEYLLTEVETGAAFLHIIADGHPAPGDLPTSAWSGMETLPKEVLLRIVSLDREGRTSDGPGYPPRSILVHCNNYFSYICGTTNKTLASLRSPSSSLERSVLQANLVGYAKKQAPNAEKVRKMLKEALERLQNNSRSYLPK